MDSAILRWSTDDRHQALSVIFGRKFQVDERGICHDTNRFVLCQQPRYYQEQELGERVGYICPSLLARDVDLYAWRSRTDLVIRATARSQRAQPRVDVELSCRGSRVAFSRHLEIHGDRRVEQGRFGPRLSEPEPFESMPLRYDKAYGGTDEFALARHGDRERDLFVRRLVGDDEDRESSEFSYPRNPAGKGYVTESDAVIGCAWPNIEFPGQRLNLERLVAPQLAWGTRPYPAGFDWFPHGWFPRLGFFGEMPPTEDQRCPAAEVELGLFPAELSSIPAPHRPKHGFAQAAHPWLWRERLQGDERIEISAVGRDGAPFVVVLPCLRPSSRIRQHSGSFACVAAELDLVHIEADARLLTLLWRATTAVDPRTDHCDWRQRTTYTVDW